MTVKVLALRYPKVRRKSRMPDPQTRPVLDEPPPFLGSWRNVYIAVLCYLAALIFGLYLFTQAFGHA